MTWRDLLQVDERQVLPWLGGRRVDGISRAWFVEGELPPEHGWYDFLVTGGPRAALVAPAERDEAFDAGRETVTGYLLGDRLIADWRGVVVDPGRLLAQTERVHLADLTLELFSRAVAARTPKGLVYVRQVFPLGPEAAVLDAYYNRCDSIADVREVTPALDLAFRWATLHRARREERQRELEHLRMEAERRRQEAARQEALLRDASTAVGRRALAARDFDQAARLALAQTGAEFVGARPGHGVGEMVVQFRVMQRRFECVVHKRTLQVLDSGVCLTGNDMLFTLDALPAVIVDAERHGLLHVFRHV